MQMWDSATKCDVIELTLGILMRRFRSNVSSGREERLSVQDLINFQDLSPAKENKESNKHDR